MSSSTGFSTPSTQSSVTPATMSTGPIGVDELVALAMLPDQKLELVVPLQRRLGLSCSKMALEMLTAKATSAHVPFTGAMTVLEQ